MQILLLLKTLQQQIAMPRINIPVEIAEVVSGGILAMFGEFDPRTQLHRATLCQQRTAKDPFRDNRQVFESSQKVGRKKHGEKDEGRGMRDEG